MMFNEILVYKLTVGIVFVGPKFNVSDPHHCVLKLGLIDLMDSTQRNCALNPC